MNVDYRLADENDAPEILNMMEHFYSIYHYPYNKNKTRANLFVLLADPKSGYIWMILSDQQVIGYIVLAFGFSFEYGGRDAFIDELFIKTAFRGKGIGKRTMDFIQEEAKKLGVQVIHLEVEQYNAGGLHLYQEKGFTHNGRILLSKRLEE